MISYPPTCSDQWTPEERLRWLDWYARMMLTRIREDNPEMPVLAKRPVHEAMLWVQRMATWPAWKLEAHRELIEKPVDDALNYHEVWMVV